MNCSNLHLMSNRKMVSFLYKALQACLKSVLHFMSVLKFVRMSPASHYKVIYMDFFAMNTGLTKFENCSTWKNLRYQFSSLFRVLSVIRMQVAWQSWWQLRCLLFESGKRKRLTRHRLLIWKWSICKINRWIRQSGN